MDPISAIPIQTFAQYNGQFSAPAFKLLNNVVVLYENLIGHLKRHGASVGSLKYEVGIGDFSQANINCTILNFNAIVKLRLEAIEISFHNLAAVGEELAFQVINDAWKAAKDSYEPLILVEHTMTVTSHLRLIDVGYDELLRNFVKMPEGLSGATKSGVVFYLGEESASGLKKGNILLDQSLAVPGQLSTLVSLTFDATKVPPEKLRGAFNGQFKLLMEKVGLVYVAPKEH